MKKKQISNINIQVELDQNKIPEHILWNAPEGGMPDFQQAKAAFVSLWDDNAKETLRIDLWTKDMEVNHMKRFFYQTFLSMSESFYRATGDEKMMQTIQDFCDYFAEKMEIKQQ